MILLVSVDEHTQNAIEIISEGAKLTEQTLLFVLKSLVNLLEDSNNKEQVFINDNTKEGKQKIKDLVKKHEDNVYALDQNLTKEQLKDYEKEFKKLGVDFSVTKNDDDSYSFFFAGQQANIIEKALKNISELKSAVLENEEVKEAEKELNELKQTHSPERVEEVKRIYDELYDINDRLNNLSPEEKVLYEKIDNLDSLKKDVKESIKEEKLISEIQSSQNEKSEVETSNEQTVNNMKSPQNENSELKTSGEQKVIGNTDANLNDLVNNIPQDEQAESSIIKNENTDPNLKDLFNNMPYETNEQFPNDKVTKLSDELHSLNEQLNNLSPGEMNLYEKIDDLNSLKKDVTESIKQEKLIDEMQTFIDEKFPQSKEVDKGITKGSVKKDKIDFSMKGVKKLNTEINAKEHNDDKSKKKEQNLSR